MKFLYIVLFLALSSAVFAQSNYHQGYVIKPNGDTAKGYIDYREWARNPSEIDFKASKEDKQIQQFNPGTIKKFQITGMVTYVSYTGVISMDKTRFPDLPIVQDTSKMIASIFLKQMATGSNLTLFYDVDEVKSRFFIAETMEKPVELVYYQYYSDQKDVIEKMPFHGQLIFFINKFGTGNTNLISKAEHASYSEADLTFLTDALNGNQSDKTHGNLTNNPNAGVRFFAGAGIFYTNTAYHNKNFTVQTGYGINTYNASSSSNSTIPQLNLGLDVFVNPNVQQFIFRTELSLSYLSTKLNYPVSGQQTPVNDVLAFNQFTATITPQFIFNIYNSDRLKVYVDAGAALHFSGYSNTGFTNATTGANDPNEPGFEFSSFWVGLPLQTGVVINKKFEVFIASSLNAKFTSNTYDFIDNRSTGVGVKYLFENH
jgi:hypothetical protein